MTWLGRTFFAAALLAVGVGQAQAGILVGSASGNDHHADVLAVVQAYNTANDPDLPEDFELFKKTDDDAAFVFDAANGFTFWDAEMGGNQLTTEGALTGVNTAWFEYSGPAGLLYYSVKGGPEFSVYTAMPGRNLITVDGSNADISHVSFWVPEPSSLGLASLAGLALVSRARRRVR
jgi:hypothetical protein